MHDILLEQPPEQKSVEPFARFDAADEAGLRKVVLVLEKVIFQ